MLSSNISKCKKIACPEIPIYSLVVVIEPSCMLIYWLGVELKILGNNWSDYLYW